jgi:hypothetical protein
MLLFTLENEPSPSTINSARTLVLGWLREARRNPMFLVGYNEQMLECADEQIVARFMSWAIPAGFTCALHEIGKGESGYEVFWTFQGSELIGFKQPPPAGSPANARLVGAAALLRNAWCHSRLQ